MKEWFLFDQEKQEGPYQWNEMVYLLKSRSFSESALIWKQGMANWMPLADFMKEQGFEPPKKTKRQTGQTSTQKVKAKPTKNEPAVGARIKQTMGQIDTGVAFAGQVVATAGAGFTPPWQTTIGNQPPDLSKVLTLVTPTAKKVVGATVKQPALSLAIITAMDLTLMLITGGLSSVILALPRLASGFIASATGLIGASHSGLNRLITVGMSLITLWTQGLSALEGLGLLVDYGFFGALPMIVTCISALLTAFRLFWRSARGAK